MASYSRRPPRLTVMRVEAAALVLPLPPPLLLLLLLHSAQQVDAYMLGDGPNPLLDTGYISEHGNFLCAPFFGENVTGDTYELPCRAPRDDWNSSFLNNEFVITAWWPPTMNAIHQYADAGFNLVMGGNMVRGCQLNGSMPSPASATEAFGCFLEQLPIIGSLGLRVAYASGGYNHSTRAADLILGGAGAMGGVTDEVNFSHPVYPTAPEVAWVVRQLEARNLSHLVVQYFLHDDVVANNQAINDAVAWLRHHKPSIVPQTNTGNQGYDTLYQDRQPTFVPEEYVSPPDCVPLHRCCWQYASRQPQLKQQAMDGAWSHLRVFLKYTVGTRSMGALPTPRVRQPWTRSSLCSRATSTSPSAIGWHRGRSLPWATAAACTTWHRRAWSGCRCTQPWRTGCAGSTTTAVSEPPPCHGGGCALPALPACLHVPLSC
eukprot:COSAG01_NODE_2875_length_6937_cov_2.860924_1_plen_432_part_00